MGTNKITMSLTEKILYKKDNLEFIIIKIFILNFYNSSKSSRCLSSAFAAI